MRRTFPLFVSVLLLGQSAARAQSPTVTVAGERLERVLDGMHVEINWQPGQAVPWNTGTYEGDALPRGMHCSTFAAAACDRFGVYLLRPPEHPTTRLANAQAAWLKSPAAARQGWRKLASGLEAQHLANEGEVVVVAYANPDARKPGHIAVVRPSDKSAEAIEAEGPQIIQAGWENLRTSSVKQGFSKFPRAWKEGRLEYYAAARR